MLVESTKLQAILEAYYQRTGYYPDRVLVDQIYPAKVNRTYLKKEVFIYQLERWADRSETRHKQKPSKSNFILIKVSA